MARLIDVTVLFQWDGENWTDETENLISASGVLEMVPPGESFLAAKQIIQQATVVLANRNLRYSIENTVSPLHPYIQEGKLYRRKCQIRFLEDPEAGPQNVFTGYIKLPAYDYVRNRVTFTVWDIGEVLRQKISTGQLLNYLEHEIVVHYLQLAGLVDGVDFVSPAYADANPGTPATIEYSTTPVPYSWLDDEPVLDEIVDIAQASGARVYVNRDGKVHYEKARLWIAQPDYVLETLDSTNLGEFTTEYDDKAFYDAIVVEYSERNLGAGPEELWSLQKPKMILPGQTEKIVARYRYPGVVILQPVANETYYLTDLAGNDVSGSVSFSVDTSYSQQAIITVENTTSGTIMLSQMSIMGYAIHGLPAEQYVVEVEGASYGRRIDVRGNPYLQTRLQAQMVGDFLAWWYSKLKIIFPLRGLPGDPRRDLGRRVKVAWYDRGNDQTYEYEAIIVRVAWNITINQRTGAIHYAQDVTALQNVFGDADYFIIGESSLNGPDVLWF